MIKPVGATQRTRRTLIAMLGIGMTWSTIVGTIIFGSDAKLSALTGPLGIFTGMIGVLYMAGSWHDRGVRQELIKALPETGGAVETTETKDTTVIEKTT